MGKFLEKWLGMITVGATATFAAYRASKGSPVSNEVMLACIWAILAGLTMTEFLKRQLTLDQIQRQLDELSPSIRKLDSRSDMYREAARMITGATSRIQDTSWGLDPADPGEVDAASRADYREARGGALRKTVSYKELYSVPSPARVEYLRGALQLGAESKSHFVKVLRKGDQPPQVEFLIVDGKEVLLSLPHVIHRRGHTSWVRLTSSIIGALLEELFDDCWSAAKTVCLSDNKVIYTESGKVVDAGESLLPA